jgi:hypothetical protein
MQLVIRRLVSAGFVIIIFGGPLAAATPVFGAIEEQGAAEPVKLLKTPGEGIQPQAAVDGKGTIHLVYFQGKPSAGDIFYTHLDAGQEAFTAPVKVNSQPGSAVAAGTIRGARIAVGRDRRVHIAWNGSGEAKPRSAHDSSPMLYTRSNADRTAFEPQRNLMRQTSELDGGGSLAADDAGNVYLAWHGRTEQSRKGEMGRRMWIAKSTDDGATFSAEAPAFDKETGACGCCGTQALADKRGTVYVLYRAATDSVGRDMYLLTSRDRGARFEGANIHPWRFNACPMSSESLFEDQSGVLAAWETEQRVYFARIDPETGKISRPISPPGGGGRKHPSVASNSKGETILAWTEGTGWQKGGALAWQVFDRSGRPTETKGRVEAGIPVWGLPTLVARPDGSFLIIH